MNESNEDVKKGRAIRPAESYTIGRKSAADPAAAGRSFQSRKGGHSFATLVRCSSFLFHCFYFQSLQSLIVCLCEERTDGRKAARHYARFQRAKGQGCVINSNKRECDEREVEREKAEFTFSALTLHGESH